MPVAAVEALEQVPVQEALVEEVVVHLGLVLEQQEQLTPEEEEVEDMLLLLLMLAVTVDQVSSLSRFPIPKLQHSHPVLPSPLQHLVDLRFILLQQHPPHRKRLHSHRGFYEYCRSNPNALQAGGKANA
jgi:hypothetical protein